MSKLAGKVAVITGSGRAIGAAIAIRYAQEGAKVVVADINGDNASSVAERIKAEGGEAIAVTMDVSDPAQVDALVATAVDTFGGLHVMLNNAGRVRDAVKHVFEADIEFFDSVIAANLRGHYLCAVAAARHMARNGGGVIINTSSGGATRAHRGMTAYDASKGGIEALTRALALDLAPYGIRVCCLVPGFIAPDDAPQEALDRSAATVPLQRAGRSEDMAGPAVFLASDDAAYVTGSKVVVDGGVLFQQRSPEVETFPVENFPKV
ncbi:SDR family oxidoreductase [Solirubrobacter sp. CPCC 204708]|uniref:SDR family oxidoreductase n=1 Tax=Solirubrobacter deserti TaxID=2282478 RepID=A0ABT4RJ62_9ACTN|nr:SDR family NAD(P)-dependent oxidoreductase [Solirubrobacter deserti]MBE2317635.1 SDR family oxidoreductase [Solirubrobacter deserti]MDA0138585.1 SDR family oxidoreductase [Solirubrobacter deserti]